jgi:hypothetical protein
MGEFHNPGEEQGDPCADEILPASRRNRPRSSRVLDPHLSPPNPTSLISVVIGSLNVGFGGGAGGGGGSPLYLGPVDPLHPHHPHQGASQRRSAGVLRTPVLFTHIDTQGYLLTSVPHPQIWAYFYDWLKGVLNKPPPPIPGSRAGNLLWVMMCVNNTHLPDLPQIAEQFEITGGAGEERILHI